MRKHYVTFLSPGTFFPEQTSKEIIFWDVRAAVAMSKDIVERYYAKPYGFYFSTRIVHKPVPDGEGGFLKVDSKEVDRTGIYFLGGKIFTLDDIDNTDEKNNTIIFNMQYNCPVAIENTNSFKSTLPFNEKDFVVDEQGNIIRRGDEPGLVAYRKRILGSEAHES
jgi:hypothetical protein